MSGGSGQRGKDRFGASPNFEGVYWSSLMKGVENMVAF
ncbi:hypothetical protein BRO54_0540 [Geobacillus proteiniphilus]|uniref:Uncharacterized protein n=1 Tax=Geobacillus proteiniphilus TaxID=860353 RepID=A0A1Q5T7D8_9BACL|nr:hypothetical protein BRO54_0540 [Geobacillus proteiniphilus]